MGVLKEKMLNGDMGDGERSFLRILAEASIPFALTSRKDVIDYINEIYEKHKGVYSENLYSFFTSDAVIDNLPVFNRDAYIKAYCIVTYGVCDDNVVCRNALERLLNLVSSRLCRYLRKEKEFRIEDFFDKEGIDIHSPEMFLYVVTAIVALKFYDISEDYRERFFDSLNYELAIMGPMLERISCKVAPPFHLVRTYEDVEEFLESGSFDEFISFVSDNFSYSIEDFFTPFMERTSLPVSHYLSSLFARMAFERVIWESVDGIDACEMWDNFSNNTGANSYAESIDCIFSAAMLMEQASITTYNSVEIGINDIFMFFILLNQRAYGVEYLGTYDESDNAIDDIPVEFAVDMDEEQAKALISSLLPSVVNYIHYLMLAVLYNKLEETYENDVSADKMELIFEDKLKDLDETISKLREKNEVLLTENTRMKADKATFEKKTEDSYKEQVKQLQYELAKANQTIEKTKEKLHKAEETEAGLRATITELNNNLMRTKSQFNNMPPLSTEEMIEDIKKVRISICGGRFETVAKLEETLNVAFWVTEKTSDQVKCDYMLVFSEFLSHLVFYKAKHICEKNSFPFGYVSGTNFELIIEQIHYLLKKEGLI